MEDINTYQKQYKFSGIFSNVGFLMLWLGQLTSQLADRVFVYVLMIIAYQLTHSNIGVAMPLLAFGIPSVIVAPWAGFFVDQLDRKWIMVITDILRGLLILLIIPLISKSVALIFFVALLIYSAAQFFAPAETSTIPEIVERKNLIIANSLFMITWMASSIVGFGLGAPLVNLLAEKGTLVASSVCYFISAASILLVPIKQRVHNPSTKKNELNSLVIGFEFIRRNHVVRYSLYKLFIASTAIATLSVLAISYANDILKIGEKNFGYLIIAVGCGMVVGTFSLEILRQYFKKGSIVVVSFIGSGIALILLSQTYNLYFALFLILLLGVGNIYITSSIQTILFGKIPKQIRGRVFGIQNMLINSAFTLPVVLFGVVADVFGILFSMALLGWLVLLMGIAGIFLPKFKTV